MDDRGIIAAGARRTPADIVVDTERSELRNSAGTVVTLRPKALALLLLLAGRARRLIEREEILDAIWPGITVCDASITQLVSELRRAIGTNMIRTVPKRGYILEQDDRSGRLVVHASVAQPQLDAVVVQDREAGQAVIVIVPFVPVASDLEHVARCVSAEVATALAQSPEFRVRIRGHPGCGDLVAVEGSEDADAPGNIYVLEGSIRRVGSWLRINCHLSGATTGLLIWAQHFQYDVNDRNLYDGFPRSVASGIRPQLQAAEFTQANRRRALDRRAYGLYLRAITAFQGPVSFGSLEEADNLLRHTLASDPKSALFLSAIAQCHALRHVEGWASPEQIQEATRIARELLASRSPDAILLSRAAFALAAIAGDHETARPALQQALALAPASYFATRTLGLTHLYTGNWRGALRCFVEAGRITKNHPSEHCRLWGMAFASFGEGHYAKSAKLASMSLRLGADFTSAWRVRAASLGQLGRVEEARVAARELLRRRPRFTVERYRAERTLVDADAAQRLDAGLAIAGIPLG